MATASETVRSMPAIAAIRASVLVPLVQQIDKRSGKADILLASHGILRSQLNDPYAMVPMARYVALFEDAASVTGEYALGALMGTMFKPGDIGPIGVLFSISATIRAAFERLGRHVNAVQGATSSGVLEDDRHLIWSYHLVDPAMWPRRQDSEFTLAASCQLARSCFSRNWRPLEVHFEHARPRDTTTLERIFRTKLLFGQSGNRFIMERSEAERIYRTEDAILAAVLRRHIADMAGDGGSSQEPVKDKVTALIGLYLGYKPITAAGLSADLNLSKRTLQRKLAEEGTTLRQMLQDYRKDVMEMALKDQVNKARIAEQLGYADTTVLWRAQKAWERPSAD